MYFGVGFFHRITAAFIAAASAAAVAAAATAGGLYGFREDRADSIFLGISS